MASFSTQVHAHRHDCEHSPPPKLNEGHALPYTDFMINPVPIRVEKSFALSCFEMDRRHWLYACSQKPFLGALLFQPFSSIHLQKLHTTNKKKTYLTVSDIYRILRKRRVLTGQDLGRKREKVRESPPGTARLLRDIANLLQNPPHFLLLGLSGEAFRLLRRSLKSEFRATVIWKGFLDLDPVPFWEMLGDWRCFCYGRQAMSLRLRGHSIGLGTGTDKDSRMKSEDGVPVAPASLGSCICMTQHLGSAR